MALEELIGRHHPVALKVRVLVDPLLRRRGLELVDIHFAEGTATLRIFADRPGGIGVDALQEVSQLIGDLLDAEDPIPGGRYTLEVSSPGLDRPLATARHFEAAIGEEIAIVTTTKVEGSRKHKGTLSGFDGAQVVVQAEGASRSIPVGVIDNAHVIYRFEPVQRPGKRPAAAKTRDGSAADKKLINKSPAQNQARPRTE